MSALANSLLFMALGAGAFELASEVPAGLVEERSSQGPTELGFKLKQDAVIAGIPCQAHSWLWFSNGHLKSCFLSGPFARGGLRYSGRDVTLFPDGRVSFGWLEEPSVIQGMRLRVGEAVAFYESGALVTGTLVEPAALQGISVESAFSLAEDGHLLKAVISRDFEMEGITCSAGAWAHFHPNGKLESCQLVHDQKVQGLPAKGGTRITRDASGRLTELTLAKPTTLRGLPAMANRTVKLFEDGSAQSFDLAEGRTVLGVPCNGNSTIQFHQNGKLALVRLGAPYQQGKATFANQSIWFDSQGVAHPVDWD